MRFILGQKLGMTQIFRADGEIVPVTLLLAGPCQVLQIKTKDKDKYEAVQIGFIKKTKNVKKPEKGKEYKYLREFPISNSQFSSKIGETIDISIFKEGDKINISGISKGKGFQGAVKRWGFKGKKSKTHGTKHETRTLGSTGRSNQGRVIKGKKMPGRMGSQRTTIKNSEIIVIDKENNLLAVKGALPGKSGTLLEIRG